MDLDFWQHFHFQSVLFRFKADLSRCSFLFVLFFEQSQNQLKNIFVKQKMNLTMIIHYGAIKKRPGEDTDCYFPQRQEFKALPIFH